MFCPKCQGYVQDGKNYCPDCGEKMINEVPSLPPKSLDTNSKDKSSSKKKRLMVTGILVGIFIGTAIGYAITPGPGLLGLDKPSLREVITMKSDSYSRGDGTWHYTYSPNSTMGKLCNTGRTYIFLFSLICGASGGFIGMKLSKQ